MSRHIRTEVLASFIEGDVKPRKAAKISAHLAVCTLCSANRAELLTVSTLLASVQFPPMPEQLSVRIEMAIATESTTRLASEPPSEAGRRDLPARGKHGRRGVRLPGLSSPLALRVAAGTAAVVVVAGGGYEIATHVGSSTPSHSSTGSAALSPTAGQRITQSQLRLGPLVNYEHAGHPDHIQMAQTTTDFEAGSFRTQALSAVSAVKAGSARNYSGVRTSGPASNAGASPAHTPAASNFSVPNIGKLRSCVALIAGGRNLLLVLVARYHGAAATIIVVGATSTSPAEGFAVGAGCSASNKAILFSEALPQL